MSSDTPRTDDRQRSRIDDHIGDAYDYARDLERELAAMTAERDRCRNSVVEAMVAFPNVGEYVAQLEAERDRAIAAHAQCDRERQALVETLNRIESESAAIHYTTKEGKK